MALIRGVGLCEAHLKRVAAVAAEQDTDPGSLSRAVILTLLQREADPTPSEDRLRAPLRLPRRLATRPGFYWVYDEATWTIVQVTKAGTFLRLGSAEEFPLEEQPFGRMIPVHQPQGFPWDPFTRR